MALKPQPNSLVFIKTSDGLDHETLNKAFHHLLRIDKQISEAFVNTIGVWHCKWYYNSNVVGYSAGDIVWLNTEDPLAFVKSHNKIIKQFTDLKAEIMVKLPDFDASDDSIVAKYLNAMSGYVESRSANSIPLEPIFELGDYEKPIQLAISTKDNNKSSVYDKTSWKMLFVDSEENEAEIVSTILELKDKVLENHLLNYHLSGKEELVSAKLSDYLDQPSSLVEYDSANSEWYANYNANSFDPQYGLDYVTAYIRKPFYISGNVSQYQAVRYWKSGWIEHFGTVAIDNGLFSTSSDVFMKVPFDWKFVKDGSGANAYQSGELAKNIYNVLSAAEQAPNIIPPKDNLINILYEKPNIEENGLNHAIGFKDSSYNLTLFPVYQNEEGIASEYIPPTYAEEDLKQSWNSNFLTNELIENRKDKTGFSLRKDTRIIAPYVSYYATGIGDF